MFWNELNNNILLLLIVCNVLLAMEEMPSEELLTKTKEAQRAEYIQKEGAEKIFTKLIEHPFDQNEQETLDLLEQVLAQGVNPYRERKSLYEMCGLKPLNYLLFHTTRANEEQKTCIEKMIETICSYETQKWDAKLHEMRAYSAVFDQ